MSDWRLAKSLAVLRDQVNASAPGRNKDSDGTIGDTAHAARKSDHNPNSNGVVQAIDFTHSPETGFDSYKFAEILRNRRDPRIKYVISNRKIFSSTVSPWQWRTYSGSNPHSAHVHVSVGDSPSVYDDTHPWELSSSIMPQDTPNIPDPLWPYQARGSWYSQLPPKWVDEEDEPNSNALRVPDSQQGISLPSRSTLGQYFDVLTPDGRVFPHERQTDIGPATSTGRGIDISAALADRMGYTPNTFPTDSIFKWRPSAVPTPTPTTTPTPQPLPQLDPAVVQELAKLLAPVVSAVLQGVVQKGPSFWSQLLGGAVTGSPFIAIGLALLQVFLTNADVLGMPGVGGTTTANNVTGGLLAMFVAGIANWFRPKEPAK